MKSITDFRKIKAFVAIARAAGQENEIIDRFKTFVDDDNFLIEDLEIDTARVHKHARTIGRSAIKLREQLDEMSVDEYLGEEGLWEELERLANAILKKAADADRRRIT